jgi:hypothetical protein
MYSKIEEQKLICLKYRVEFIEFPFNSKVGIINVKEPIYSINGLRHLI